MTQTDPHFDWIDPDALPGMKGVFRALLAKDPVLGERFPLRFWEPGDRERALSRRQSNASPQLWDRMAAEAKRLGAAPLGLDLLEQIRRGQGIFVFTGQQPGFLGGPLYTLYKVATAVELAAWIRHEHDIPCAPVLWNAGDDADFEEIATATLPTPDLGLLDLSLDSAFHGVGGWVGNLSLDSMEVARSRLAPFLTEAGSAREVFDRAWECSRDIGDLFSALYLELFGDQGLLIVDARWDEIRHASRDLFARYTEAAETIHREVQSAGNALAELGLGQQLSSAASRFGLLVVEDGHRVEVPPDKRIREALARIKDRPETLAPNVLLRPAVQDSLFPVAAVVLGPGETGYWAQIKDVYDHLGVEMPLIWPRMTATLVPAEAEEILGSRSPGDALMNVESLIEDRQWEAVPEAVREGLDDLTRSLSKNLGALRQPLEDVDRSLGEMLESAERKMRFQIQRIGEQAVRKLRSRSSQMIQLGHIRNLFYPGARLQERSLASLWPLLHRGPAVAEELVSLARLHRERLLRDRGAHIALRFVKGP